MIPLLRRPPGARALVVSLALVALACSPFTLVKWMLSPDDEFDPSDVPPAPEYSSPAAWAARPDALDKADLTPAGLSDAQAEAPADVFFIHPTTFYTGSGWNADLHTPRAQEILDEAVMGDIASIFNGCCRVFAPRYRQATLATFMVEADEARPVMQVAYDDIRAAFFHYLERDNGGRPFILASHSQGSLHAQRLLAEVDKMDAVRARLVAAYVVGYRLPRDRFQRDFTHLPPCAAPTDTGCVVAWDTYQEGAEVRGGEQIFWWDGDRLTSGKERPTHCTNPISWTTGDGLAPAAEHKGASRVAWSNPPPKGMSLFRSDEATGMSVSGLTDPQPGLVSARCEDGILRISAIPDEVLAAKIMGGQEGNYHLIDFNLFYLDVRANARARVDAWLAAHAPPAPAEDGAAGAQDAGMPASAP